jgi:hypothetical protein
LARRVKRIRKNDPAKDPGRQAHQRKIGGRLLDVDYESRPNVRLKSKRRLTGTKAKKVLIQYAEKALKVLQNNISTNMGGRWPRLTWGKKAGGMALLHTEDHWRIFQNHPTEVKIRPRKDKVAMWRGHTGGTWIYPKARKFLHWVENGVKIFMKKVKLPRRDPRPTQSQLSRIRMGE